jgi:peptidoglycan/LPS O-acetylase OafA/YrhL
MRRRAGAGLVAVLLVSLLVPAVALAKTGHDVGDNLAKLLRHYAAEMYGGVVAVVSLVFLINRRYTELASFLLASIVVAWFVFSPDQIADAARSIGRQIF